MVGIYFSGTGNTRHCIETFVQELDKAVPCFAIEDPRSAEEIIKSDVIILAYPIYFSNLPKIVSDFIANNGAAFHGKKVFIISTMGLFSGDGTGCSARLLKKYGAKIMGGLHVKMPDCIGDEKLLKKSLAENRLIVKQSEGKIKKAADDFKNNTFPGEGLSFFHHIAGLFGQRLWFYDKTKQYSHELKIDSEKCKGCGLCTQICPMENLSIENGIATAHNHCTMCYRCISHCPNKAITLLGTTIYEQCKIENYL